MAVSTSLQRDHLFNDDVSSLLGSLILFLEKDLVSCDTIFNSYLLRRRECIKWFGRSLKLL